MSPNFSNHKNKSSARYARLKRDYEETQSLIRKMPEIDILVVNGSSDFYRIKFDILSMIQLEDKNLAKRRGFFFDVRFPEDYPEQPPKCMISPFTKIPFHPHIRIAVVSGNLSQLAEWVDYKEYNPNEGLGWFLRRIAYSLQYDPYYIDTRAVRIGNPEALSWYKKHYKAIGNLFLTDKIEIPEELTIFKKFTIEPKKFEITDATKPYQPFKRAEPEFNIISESAVFDNKFDEFHRLYLISPAMEQIKDHIVWGKRSKINSVEQGGLLLGRVFKDIKKNIIYAIVDQSIAGQSAKGSGAYLRMDHLTWKEMIDHVDEILDSDPERNSQVIGWYHTHPADLPVFMSGTDKTTQRCMFSKDWHFAVVLNPHKRVWRVFFGADSRECKGFLV